MWQVLASFAFVVAFLIFLKLSFWRRKCCQQLPGRAPNFFNVFGNLTEVFLHFKDVHIGVQNVFKERSETFRKDKMFCIWASYLPFVCLIKADAVKEMMQNNKMNEKGFMYDWFEPAIGKGLITSSAAKAKFRRKLLTPSFHPDVLKTHISVFNEYSEEIVNFIKKETTEDISCIQKVVTLATIDMIMETMFGIKFNALKDGNSIFEKGVVRSEGIVMGRIYKPWIWPDFIFWRSAEGKELQYYIDFLDGITTKIFREKKEKYLSGEVQINSGKYKSFMELLLEKSLETEDLSEEDIMEEAKTFALAGHETIAAAVVWALFLIGHHPDVQAKIHEEIDQVFGEDVNRPVTERDLKDLEYLDCVLKEVNRIYPPVPQFVRRTIEDTPISGYVIPKGASVIVLTYFLHRDPDVFPEPNKFDPDRFLPENAVKIPEYGYLPFSAGPRMCPGYKFAEMELKTIMCHIMRNFTVKSLDDREKMERELTFKIALHPASSIHHRFRPRSFKNKKKLNLNE